MRISLKEDEMSKKDASRSIKMEQEMDDFAVRVAGKLDCSVSELFRTVLITGAPLVLACPSLIKRASLDDMDLTTLGF